MGPGVNVDAVGHHDYVEYGIVECRFSGDDNISRARDV